MGGSQESLAVVVDSIVRHAIAAHDSTLAARSAREWYVAIVQHPLFGVFWPIAVSGVGFWIVKGVEWREKAKDRTTVRGSAAKHVRNFLDTAAKELRPLVKHLGTAHATTFSRGHGEPRADYVRTHLDKIADVRGSLLQLEAEALVSDVEKWHQATLSSLDELHDFCTMKPGHYMDKYMPGGDQGGMLVPRFEAIRTALHADADDAVELTARLDKIAGRGP